MAELLADDAVLAKRRARLDLDVLADQRGAVDARIRIQDRPLPHPDVVGDLEPGISIRTSPSKASCCAWRYALDVADVAPVPVRDVAVHRRAALEQLRNKSFEKS